MAPKRRTSTPRTASTSAAVRGAQSTLSFQNKVTKPISPRSAKGKAAKKDLESKAAAIEIEAEDAEAENSTAEATVKLPTLPQSPPLSSAQPAAVLKVADPVDEPVKTEEVLGGRAETSDLGALGGLGSGWVGDEEARARKLPDAQIKRYWAEKEAERLVPRVHQEGLGLAEKVLREWDMSGQFGPCIGIVRLKRWKRANVLGLNPPIEVLAVLLKEQDKGNGKIQRAHVDELMSSRFVET
ncbi:hypothetical protein LTR95_006040 [Oleoguttula sp. CCFEE 5521]